MLRLDKLKPLCAAMVCLVCSVSSCANENTYKLNYFVSFEPATKRANVQIQIEHTHLINEIDFNIAESQCDNFESNDPLEQTKQRLVWHPRSKKSDLSYSCKIDHLRNTEKRSYDALITKEWTIFRGDDLVPAARVRAKAGAHSAASMRIDLPDEWENVNTGWPTLSRSLKHKTFAINNPQRNFDRPTGWIIAGNLGTRRSQLESDNGLTNVAVSAPRDSNFRRMDILAFINIIWPEINNAFSVSEETILIIGGDNPMWRGGLSAGNSFYIHSDRPIISENGTSTLVHELFHMVTGIRGAKNDDWIAEGLAEYYSFELLHRAGATNQTRKEYTLQKLETWSRNVDSVFTSESKGQTTAKAALVFFELNKEIEQLTNNQDNLDSLVRLLVTIDQKKNQKGASNRVSLSQLNSAFQTLTNRPSKVLKSL